MGTAIQKEIAQIEDDLESLLLNLVRKRTQIIDAVLLGADIWSTGEADNNAKNFITGSTYSDLKALGIERGALRAGTAVFLDDHSPGAWDDSISVVSPTTTQLRVQLSGDPIEHVGIVGPVVDGTRAFLSLNDSGVFQQFVGEDPAESRQFTDALIAGTTTVYDYTLTSALPDIPELEATFRVNRQDGAPVNYWGTVVMKGLERNETLPLRWWRTSDEVFIFDFAAFTGFLGGLTSSTNTPMVKGVVNKSTEGKPRSNPYFPYTTSNHPEGGGVYVGTTLYKGRQQQQDHRWNFDAPGHSTPYIDVSDPDNDNPPLIVDTLDVNPFGTDIASMLATFDTGHNPNSFQAPFGAAFPPWTTAGGPQPEAIPEDHGLAAVRLIENSNNLIQLGLQTGILAEAGGQDLIANFISLKAILTSYEDTRGTTYWNDDDNTSVRNYLGTTWESGGLTRANIESELIAARDAANSRISQIGTYIGTVTTAGSRAKAMYDHINFAINLEDGWLRDMLQRFTAYTRGLSILGDFLERHNLLQALVPVERSFTDVPVDVTDSFASFTVNEDTGEVSNFLLIVSDSLAVADLVDIFIDFDTIFRTLADSVEMLDAATPRRHDRVLRDTIDTTAIDSADLADTLNLDAGHFEKFRIESDIVSSTASDELSDTLDVT